MSTAYLRSRMEERAGLADLTTSMLDRLAEEHHDPTPEQRQQLDNWEERCRTLDGEIAQLQTALRSNQKFTAAFGMLEEAEEAEERNAARRRDEGEQRQAPVSAGARFVASDAFRAYKGRGTSEPVEFEGFLERRAAITTSDVDVPPFYWDGPAGYTTTTPLLDTIGREVVSSGSVEFITWGTTDPLAAKVAEGEVKPEAAIVPTTTPLSLDTYAHWKAITRQALEDYPRIQSIVETKLRGGLASALEAAAAGVITAAPWASLAGETLAGGIRGGMAIVQENGYTPNAVLLNPADFAALDVASSAAGNNGPVSYPTYWGLRPIAVGALPAGAAYVGDFKEAVTWFDHNSASVYMTDSHSDYFVRNLLVILAEQRSAFAATEISAAVKVTVTPETVAAGRASSK